MLSIALLFACAPDPAPVTDVDGDGVAAPDDCDDADPAVHPGAGDTTCDGIDDDCDGHSDDEAPDARVWYADRDGDGAGDFDDPEVACEAPVGTVDDFLDCDDTDPAVFPGAADDVCDGIDHDCDGDYDEDAPGAVPWYADADGDGYGDAWETVMGCEPPPGAVADATDCDDTSADAHPGSAEACDGALDEDCDGVRDEGCGGPVGVSLDAYPVLRGESPDVVLYDQPIGLALSTGGDLDGDGLADVAVGLPHSQQVESYPGRAYVITGVPGSDATFHEAGVLLEGTATWTCAGQAVAFVEDLDADGDDELLVGGPWADRVYLVAGGPAEDRLLEDAEAVFQGEEDDMSGYDVADARGLLGDVGAVAIGAPGVSSVYVVAGDQGGGRATVHGDALCAGESLADAADLDGDGLDDLLLGGAGRCDYEEGDGAAWVVRGPLVGDVDLDDADLHLAGPADSGAGAGLLIAGDVDGDGGADLAVSAPGVQVGTEAYGVVYLWPGDTRGAEALDDAPISVAAARGGYSTGRALAGAGDVDGDGRDDLLVGDHYAQTDLGWTGAAWLVTGAGPGAWGLDTDALEITGRRGENGWGGALAGGADLDGDGIQELIIGGIGPTGDGDDDYLGAVAILSTAGWF